MVQPNNKMEEEIFSLAFGTYIVNANNNVTDYELYKALNNGVRVDCIIDVWPVNEYENADSEYLAELIEALYLAIKELSFIETQTLI